MNSSQTPALSLYSRQLPDNNTGWCQPRQSTPMWVFPPVPDRNIIPLPKEEEIMSSLEKSSFAMSFSNFSESCRESWKTLLLPHCIICCFYWKLSAVGENARIGWKGWKLVRVTRLASGWLIIEPSTNPTLRGFHQNMSNRQPVAITLLLIQNCCFVFCIAPCCPGQADVSYWGYKEAHYERISFMTDTNVIT